MTRRWMAIAGCLAAMAMISIGAWSRHRGPSPKKQTPAASQHAAVIRFASNAAPVPSFEAKDLDGKSINTAEWTGKVTLLTFWATWCPPCRAEIPELIALQKQYAGKLQIIGISADDGPPEEVKKFVSLTGINYPIVMATGEIAAKFGGVPALPTSFVINREGRVVQKHVGLYPASLYDNEVRALLGMPVDATIETFEDVGQIFLANAANATELPGVDLSKLTPQQKKVALKRINTEICSCGCKLTIAQCRINDTTCPVSGGLARKIVEEILRGVAPAPPAIQ